MRKFKRIGDRLFQLVLKEVAFEVDQLPGIMISEEPEYVDRILVNLENSIHEYRSQLGLGKGRRYY